LHTNLKIRLQSSCINPMRREQVERMIRKPMMSDKMNKNIAMFLLILAGCTALGYGLVEVIENHKPLPMYGPENHRIGEFLLTDQQDRAFHSQAHQGYIWIVNSFFTS